MSAKQRWSKYWPEALTILLIVFGLLIIINVVTAFAAWIAPVDAPNCTHLHDNVYICTEEPMSDSYKDTPIIGMTGDRSEKVFKRFAHRSLRRAVKMKLAAGEWETLPKLREVSNRWDWPQDGRQYLGADVVVRK